MCYLGKVGLGFPWWVEQLSCAYWSDAPWRISCKGLPISTKYSSLGPCFWLRVFNQHLTPLIAWIGASIKLFYWSLYKYRNNGILEPQSCSQKHFALLFLGHFWCPMILFKKSECWWHAVLPRDIFLLPGTLTKHCYWGSTAQHHNRALVGRKIFLAISNKNHCRLQQK